MEEWPFDQGERVAAITLKRIIVDGGPILYVSHDLDDNGWQFLDGHEMTPKDAMIVGMRTIVNYDVTVKEIASMLPGYYATRRFIGDKWLIRQAKSTT